MVSGAVGSDAELFSEVVVLSDAELFPAVDEFSAAELLSFTEELPELLLSFPAQPVKAAVIIVIAAIAAKYFFILFPFPLAVSLPVLHCFLSR